MTLQHGAVTATQCGFFYIEKTKQMLILSPYNEIFPTVETPQNFDECRLEISVMISAKSNRENVKHNLTFSAFFCSSLHPTHHYSLLLTSATLQTRLCVRPRRFFFLLNYTYTHQKRFSCFIFVSSSIVSVYILLFCRNLFLCRRDY